MSLKKRISEFLQMSVGMVLLTVGVYFFKIPNGFSTGGVSGIGTLLGTLCPHLSPATWISLINILLLLVGFVVLGRDTGAKTVYCSLLFSGLTSLCEWLVPLSAPLTDQPFLELCYAILLTGCGSALAFNVGASSGGTDIVALILKKYSRLNVGKALLCTDFLIAAGAFYVFGIKAGLYSILGLFSKAFLVDGIIENINSCKYFVVITDHAAEVREYIIKEMHHGVTDSAVIGGYTHKERTMLHTVCRRGEAVRLRRRIREIDPRAFIIITTSNEIIGRGFRSV